MDNLFKTNLMLSLVEEHKPDEPLRDQQSIIARIEEIADEKTPDDYKAMIEEDKPCYDAALKKELEKIKPPPQREEYTGADIVRIGVGAIGLVVALILALLGIVTLGQEGADFWKEFIKSSGTILTAAGLGGTTLYAAWEKREERKEKKQKEFKDEQTKVKNNHKKVKAKFSSLIWLFDGLGASSKMWLRLALKSQSLCENHYGSFTDVLVHLNELELTVLKG